MPFLFIAGVIDIPVFFWENYSEIFLSLGIDYFNIISSNFWMILHILTNNLKPNDQTPIQITITTSTPVPHLHPPKALTLHLLLLVRQPRQHRQPKKAHPPLLQEHRHSRHPPVPRHSSTCSLTQLLDDKSNIHDQDVRNDSLIHFKFKKQSMCGGLM